MEKTLTIVVPMAGKGSRFADAGYSFPKPLIEIRGKTMIETVAQNLKPSFPHKFVFICQKEHYDKFDLHNILRGAAGHDSEIVQINGITEGAACTVLTAISHINNDNDLLIANSDQYLEVPVDEFILDARSKNLDGHIMTFEARHPKWSYARVNPLTGHVVEVAEKKVISNDATVGLYYFAKGSDFVRAAENMILKQIKHNNEYYVCPVYNELILDGKKIGVHKIPMNKMHGLGTPEDLTAFIAKLNSGDVILR